MAIERGIKYDEVPAVLQAAMELDRANLENAEVHPCDRHIAEARRRTLHNEQRALSEALAAAGLALPSEHDRSALHTMPCDRFAAS